METTQHGLQKPDSQDIYPFNTNVNILEEHLSDTDIHVNASEIAGIAELDELTQINSSDTNSTMWGKIKKSISEVTNHVDKVASETTLGHIKIGTGLQALEDGTTSVKIVNNLNTNDSTITLSAAMGKSLNEALNGKAPTNHASSATGYGVGNAFQYGHVKLCDNYTSNIGNASSALGASQDALYNCYYDLNNKLAYSSGTAAINTTYFILQTYGYIKWHKFGRLVIVDIYGITQKPGYSTDNVAVLATGLPAPVDEYNSFTTAISSPNSTAPAVNARFRLRTDGRLMPWYYATTTVGDLNGNFSYISAN